MHHWCSLQLEEWPECTVFFKRLADILAEKKKIAFQKMMFLIRCKISFSLLRSAIRAIRGTRSQPNACSLTDFHRMYICGVPCTSPCSVLTEYCMCVCCTACFVCTVPYMCMCSVAVCGYCITLYCKRILLINLALLCNHFFFHSNTMYNMCNTNQLEYEVNQNFKS